jgi:hypothetical protein
MFSVHQRFGKQSTRLSPEIRSYTFELQPRKPTTKNDVEVFIEAGDRGLYRPGAAENCLNVSEDGCLLARLTF